MIVYAMKGHGTSKKICFGLYYEVTCRLTELKVGVKILDELFADQKWFNYNLNRGGSAVKLILKAIMKTASKILTRCRSIAALSL